MAVTYFPGCRINQEYGFCDAHQRSELLCEARFEERLECAATARALLGQSADVIADAIMMHLTSDALRVKQLLTPPPAIV